MVALLLAAWKVSFDRKHCRPKPVREDFIQGTGLVSKEHPRCTLLAAQTIDNTHNTHATHDTNHSGAGSIRLLCRTRRGHPGADNANLGYGLGPAEWAFLQNLTPEQKAQLAAVNMLPGMAMTQQAPHTQSKWGDTYPAGWSQKDIAGFWSHGLTPQTPTMSGGGASAGGGHYGAPAGAMRGIAQRQEFYKSQRSYQAAKADTWRQKIAQNMIANGRPIPQHLLDDPKWAKYLNPSTTAGGATTGVNPQPNYQAWMQRMAVWR